MRTLLCTFMAAVALSGCKGEPEPPPATLTDIQERVFTPGCANSACHGAAAAGGLDLSAGNAHANLVDVAVSNEVAAENGWVRVLPGDPDRSFLVRKLEQPGIGEGSPMPSSAQVLHPLYLEQIRTWIQEGAQQ